MKRSATVKRTSIGGVTLEVRTGSRIDPTIPITDPRFRYRDSANTDIRKTFARVRWERERAGKLETREFVGTLEVDVVDLASRRQR